MHTFQVTNYERLCSWSGNGFVAKISGKFEGLPGHDPWDSNKRHLYCLILNGLFAKICGMFDGHPCLDPWNCSTRHLYCLVQNNASTLRKNTLVCASIIVNWVISPR